MHAHTNTDEFQCVQNQPLVRIGYPREEATHTYMKSFGVRSPKNKMVTKHCENEKGQ